MKIIIINGPNLNLLGTREPDVYGNTTFDEYFETLKAEFPNVELEYFQSNHEGAIIDKIHETGFTYDGLIINAGAYTHTSIAIADAMRAVTCRKIEVHISNVYKREKFRHQSYLSEVCDGMLTGFGLDGYRMALSNLNQKYRG